MQIFSALLSAFTGVFFVIWLGESGVLWFVLIAPAISVFVARHYTAFLPAPETAHDWGAINQQWLALLKLGLPLMAAGLLTLATQLFVRSTILRELGLDAAGYFQAAWTISMTYIGFVLGAMSSDYYPRLTAIMNDHAKVRKLVNEQAEMSLLLAGPILIAMITLAPWVIRSLYAESFAPASDVLRLQVLGDLLKVSSWPMGFILLGQGRGGLFIASELTWNISYLVAIVFGIQEFGLIVAGWAFCLAYLIYYCLLIAITSKLVGFRLARRNWMFTLILTIGSGSFVFVAGESFEASTIIGVILTIGLGLYSSCRLFKLLDVRVWISQRIRN